METQTSLDYLIETEEFLGKFSTALENEDGAVRKHTFEILAALCVYSKEGYTRALGVLEHYKNTKKKKYRFSLVVDELRSTDNVHYKIILLEFINCLIIYTEKAENRIRIRNEFFSLKLQEILNSLKSEEEQHIVLQLQVFEDHKANDDEQYPGVKGIDLNSAFDIFNAIFKQVSDSPLELYFLTCLQHLLKIDNTDALADKIWQTVDQLISKCALIESPEEAQKLLVTSSRKFDKQGDGKCCCSCHKDGGERGNTGPKVRSGSVNTSDDMSTSQAAPPPPPPPPPPPGAGAPPPPPCPPPPMAGGPPPPPPFPGGPASPIAANNKQTLPQQNTPKPKGKMRCLQWQKIPIVKVMGKTNLWTMLGGKSFNGYKLDYHKMDDLFSVNVNPQTPADLGTPGTERKKKENTEVTLIESRRSMNVNIFLKQFRMPNEEIVRLLREGNSGKLGAEKLRGLQKLLPTHDEVDIIKGFDGDKEKLGDAEKFFVCLMSLPNYNLRIEGLLIKEEFNDNMEWIRPSIESIIQAAKDIKDNRSLRELIYLVLIAGNYLNSGNYAGNAAGFKLSSLVKLTEIRANKPRMNLMHYVVMEAEENNPRLLNFPDEMKALKDASQTSIDSLSSDILSLANKVTAITDHIHRMNDNFRPQMEPFLKEANYEMLELKEDLKDIDRLRTELAEFLSEEPNTFKLEECFKTLSIFCERFKKAIEENRARKVQEEKAKAKRKQKESEHNKRSRDVKEPHDQSMDGCVNDDGSIVDMLLADVRSGFASCPLGDNSFSVTKVKKVNLDSLNVGGSLQTGVGEIGKGSASDPAIDPNDFVRLGFGRVSMRRRRLQNHRQSDSPTQMDSTDTESTCSSLEDATSSDVMNTKRSRKSYATSDDESLIDFLMQSGEEPDKTPFDKNGSMRRRRKERLEHRGLLDVFASERERAPSPALSDSNCDKSQGINDSPLSMPERPAFDVVDKKSESPIRRTRSMVDKTTVDRALAKAKEATSGRKSVDDSDHEQFLSRIKRKLYKKTEDSESNRKSPVILTETDNILNSSVESPTEIRPRNRWRNGITNSVINESPRTLETISEKDKSDFSPTEDDNNNTKSTDSLHRSKEQFSNRFRNTLDSAELSKIMQDMSNEPKEVNVSISEQLNRTYNLKEELKKVETGEKPLGSELSNRSETPDISEENLKKKRERRKMRSQLSIDEVHKALKQDDKPELTPKSPVVPPRRSRSNSENKPQNSSLPSSPSEEKHILGKSPKLVGKQKFRHDRFGDKNISDTLVDRCKSNVEIDHVDMAIKDYVSQGNMSRSKSYDESVARQALGGDKLHLRNSGSTPDTCAEKLAIRRGSTSRLSTTDDRRYGRVFANDDSDNEHNTNSTGKLQYNSDSPMSQSRISIRSTNTSTETLQANHSDGDTSPESRRKSSSNDIEDKTFQRRVQENPISLQNGQYSPTPGWNDDFDNDDPVKSLSRWKQTRRSLRVSTGEFIDHDTKSYKLKHNNFNRSDINHSLSPRNDANDLKNEVGSRSSYASSQDEGFESMSGSGTGSQRASMVSTVDSSDTVPSSFYRSPNPQPLPTEIVEEDKKRRTESWTASTLNATAVHNTSLDTSVDYNPTPSVKIHDIPKGDIWSDNLNDTIKLKTTPIENDIPITPIDVLKTTKSTRNTPSYMRGTHSSTTKTPPPVTDNKLGNKNVRSSMRVTQTLRRSAAQTSNLSKSKTATGSNTSLTASNSSDLSTSTTQSKVSTVRRRLTSTPNNRPTTPSSRPTTPSARPTTQSTRSISSTETSMSSSRVSSTKPSPSSSNSMTPSSTTATKPLSRTQSMRVTSATRKSINPAVEITRSKTPSADVTETPRKRMGFMEPTASFRAARKELPQIPSPESTIKARSATASSGYKPAGNLTPSPLTRHGSMRRSNKSPTSSTQTIEEVSVDKGRITPTRRVLTKENSKQLPTVSESRINVRKSESVKLSSPIADTKRKGVK